MSISIYQLPTGRWRADVAVGSVRKSKVHRLKGPAQNWARETERDLILSAGTIEMLARQRIKVTVAELLRRYAETESPKKKTAKREKGRIEFFMRELPFAESLVERVTHVHLERWADSQMRKSINPLSPSSVLRDYSILGAAFEWGKRQGWMKHNPVRDARKPEKPEHRTRRVHAHEVELILHALKYELGDVPKNKSQEVGLIWLIALATGMRSGEIVNRLRSEVMIDQRCVLLPDSKNGSKRLIPLDGLAVKLWQLALMIRPRGRPGDLVFSVTDASRDALWRKARKVAELEDSDLRFHDSRHEAASLMAKRIPNALTLCKIFGWKDPKYALVYYNPSIEEMVQQLDAVKQHQVVPEDFLLTG